MNIIQKKFLIMSKDWYQFDLTGYRHVQSIRAMVNSGHLQLHYQETPDEYMWEYHKHLDFKDPKTTSTYQECITIELRKDQTIAMMVYDGETLNGNPTDLRYTFVFTGDWFEYIPFVDLVNRRFIEYTNDLREEMDDQRKENQRMQIANDLLFNFKAE